MVGLIWDVLEAALFLPFLIVDGSILRTYIRSRGSLPVQTQNAHSRSIGPEGPVPSHAEELFFFQKIQLRRLRKHSQKSLKFYVHICPKVD